MKNIYWILIATILLGACSQQQTSLKKEDNKPFSIQINPEKSQVIEHGGLIMLIPQNVFVYEDGAIVKESIVLQIRSAFKLPEMAQYGLQTRMQDAILVSGGMFNIEASTRSGKKISIAKDKAITVQVAQNILDSSDYQIFYSRNGSEWEDPRPSSNYLTYLPLDKHAVVYVYGKRHRDGHISEPIFTKRKKHYEGYELLDSAHTTKINDAVWCFTKEPPFLQPEIINKSYIASKEYEDRFFAFPPLLSETYMELHCTYLQHVAKPLWEVDSILLKDYEAQLEKELATDKNMLAVEELRTTVQKLKMFKAQYKTHFSPEFFSQEEQEKLQQLYRNMEANSFVQSYTIQKTGWHNLDYFYSKALKPIALQVETNMESNVLLILKDARFLMNARPKNATNYCFAVGDVCEFMLPPVSAYIVGIATKNGNIYFAQKEIRIGAVPKISLELKPSDQKTVTKAMEDIEKGYK